MFRSEPMRRITPDWRSVKLSLLISLILGALVTFYAEDYQMSRLMPLRNRIVLGTWSSQSNDKGIPSTRYRSGSGHNPVHIAQTVRPIAIGLLEDPAYLSTIHPNQRARLRTVAEYFLHSGQPRQFNGIDYLIWEYTFPLPKYAFTSPWVSGMAQAHIVEVLLGAFRVSQEQRYLDAAVLAGNAMRVPVDSGGVAVFRGDGVWFAEYAKPGIPPPKVLNGHNYALNAVWHLSAVDSSFSSVFEDGVQALRSVLVRFDAIVWSNYDLVGTPANRKYHKIHVDQLDQLCSRAGLRLFCDYSDRFRWQLLVPAGLFYRLTVEPNPFLLVLILLNSLLVLMILYCVWWGYEYRGKWG